VHSKESSVYLEQIVRFVEEIRDFTKSMTLESFTHNLMCRYAVTYALQSISEASRRLSDPVRASYPQVPWTEIHAAGNVYRHEYAVVSAAMLWKTVTRGLDELYRAAKTELARM
jgi:uncharacterized protein with HEPN domain